jgi:23S rRNA pseudouridine1911/1915/1917 synthase
LKTANENKLPQEEEIRVNEKSLLMDFLIRNLKTKSRDNIKSLLKYKQVRIDGQPVTRFDFPLHPGQKIVISRNRNKAGDEPVPVIVFEDPHFIIIDKEAGLLSMAAHNGDRTAYSMLSAYVKKENPKNRIFIIHRLDRETSGLMMYAKSEKAQELMQSNWKTAVTERTYLTVVEGIMEPAEGTIESYLFEDKNYVMHSSKDPSSGELASTSYKMLKHNAHYSLLEVNLLTGKKNQIRVHMKDTGHPVAGDRKYGATSNPAGRVCLHASVLSFQHPVSHKKLKFVSEMPAGFRHIF